MVMRLMRLARTATIFVLTSALVCAPLLGQTPEPAKQDKTDVLRVFTELVQTDVMVFDKEGRFVDGLKKENFELRIDGQPKQIDFFERVTAGSVNEESQLAAARGSANRINNPGTEAPAPLDRGRPIFFYIDDLHLDLGSLNAAKKVISAFVDKEMGQNDEVAITSASGQIGFLQQLTDNKTVLHAALGRLKFRPYLIRDNDTPPMTEYQAMLIGRYDRDVTNYFIEQFMIQNPGMTRNTAEGQVQTRARLIMQQSDNITMAALAGLDSLIRSVNKISGRKLVFLISGGFFLDTHGSSMDRIQRMTSIAARSGVVIYAMDGRGLVTPGSDASTETAFDITNRLERASAGELTASQDAMHALARDTGGKPVFNTNALGVGLTKALKETSAYYLLAWKPEGETQHASKFHRIEVKVVGKPQLNVQVRRGFFDVESEPVAAKPNKTKAPAPANKTEEQGLYQKLRANFPERAIPVSLDLNYVHISEKGWMLSTMVEVPSSFLTFETVAEKQVGAVDLAGIIYNDQGQPGSSFNQHMTLDAGPNNPSGREAVRYNYPLFLEPGLYQVRVGVRDAKSGRIGSSHRWIEIPILKPAQLGMSSVLIGVRPSSAGNTTSETSQTLTNSLELSISHRFQRDSPLRFVIFVYNATVAADSKADIALQLQLIRDSQPVMTTPLKKIPTENLADPSRMLYAAEIPLAGLPAGRYLMQVTIIDRVSKQSASQQTRLEIE
ncbi:MAG: VWA domain-containing protein [bacterium]